MRCIIFAGGEYGNDMEMYRKIINDTDIILCADGGADYAYSLGLIPSGIIGDMDSISPEVLQFYIDKQIKIYKYPCRKDFTDTQLAIEEAEKLGADEIIFLGSMGKRLDHTMSNLYAGMDSVRKGNRVIHYGYDCTVYLMTGSMELEGTKGDIVSVLSLSDRSDGIYLIGFEYPLDNVILETSNPYAISNVMAGSKGEIRANTGILAVFHYKR